MKELAFLHIQFLLNESVPKWEPTGHSTRFASTWLLTMTVGFDIQRFHIRLRKNMLIVQLDVYLLFLPNQKGCSFINIVHFISGLSVLSSGLGEGNTFL